MADAAMTGRCRNVNLEVAMFALSKISVIFGSMNKVVVGLSGGVDSSVAAAILHHQGYEVVGLTLWLMKGKGQCCSEGMVDAAKICEHLGIPHHIVDSRDVFQANIVDYLVAG